MTDLSQFTIPPNARIRDAMETIDESEAGIALVVDDDQHLIGTITDGDVRRALLAGQRLEDEVEAPLTRGELGETRPHTADPQTPSRELLRRMNENEIRQIPLVDDEGRLQNLALLSDLIETEALPLTAVVMAGGFGTRLQPLTEDVPKPMLPVGDRPLLERIVEQLREAGIPRVVLTIHYKRNQICEHFGDGSDFGVEIEYVEEDEPRGTAGSLAELDPETPLLVMNGDILTDVDVRSLFAFHRDQEAAATVAVKEHEVEVPYGVVETEGATVTGLREKPVLRRFVNAGIYLLEPSVLERVPDNGAVDMTDLVEDLLAEDGRVVSFPIREYWRDIGEPEDYRNAEEDLENGLADD